MSTLPGRNAGADEVNRRRFVVACPACEHEGPCAPTGEGHKANACALCCGQRRVPRLVAERYKFRRGPMVTEDV